ncbi:hypothetical protein AMTR_s00098p00020560 [Amborella trichopoda]|uniref:Prolyl 4-hydroxylase alpha subunit domain-containing protein n=1 Tax=Amborella trichopoda TaxID=13333 RepID=W1NYQ6_AMBTC|nr:hypothetical protein AMTR_s00098p00020560 [Amborella trichopoda]
MAIMGGRRSRSMVGRTSTCALVLAILLMLSVVLLILLALGILSLPINSKTTPDAFRNSEFRAVSIHESLNFPTDNQKSDGVDGPKQWVEVLSWAPRAFIYHNFLSKEECEYLISLSKPHMRKSTVVDSGTGRSKDSRVRTSSGMFLRRGQDKIIRNIEKRIADFTFIPIGTTPEYWLCNLFYNIQLMDNLC